MKQVRSYTLETEAIENIEKIAEIQFGNNKSMALAHIIERGVKSWKEEQDLLQNARRITSAKPKTKKSATQN